MVVVVGGGCCGGWCSEFNAAVDVPILTDFGGHK